MQTDPIPHSVPGTKRVQDVTLRTILAVELGPWHRRGPSNMSGCPVIDSYIMRMKWSQPQKLDGISDL